MDEATVRTWLAEAMPAPVRAAIDRLARSEDVRRIAVMPDVHLSADVCVGIVLATGSVLYPNAVGGDIGCGVAALAFDVEPHALADERVAAAVLSGLYAAIPCIRHSRRSGVRLPADLDSWPLSAPALEARKHQEAAMQLGTLGRGNHFAELQAGDDGRLWAMVHSGSRGTGQAIRDHHLARCPAGRQGLRFVDADSEAGRAYVADASWAIAYAAASRRGMVEAVGDVVGRVLGAPADAASFVDCNHNHVRRETHGGESFWVHRKGAMPAGDGEPGLIPGSMGTPSVHVVGRGCVEALSSSAHGAGRRLSRTDARRTISTREVGRQMRHVWFDHRVVAGLREEAPSAYKDIDDVLRAQHDLVRIVRRLRPVLSFKGV